MGADGATSHEGAAESQRRRMRRGGDRGERGERGEGGAHIVSIYHSHVTKFSPHRETLLTSTEHVAFVDIMYIIAAFPAFYGKLYWLYFQQSMSKYLIKSFDSFYYADF